MADTVITAEIKLLVDSYLSKLEEANKKSKGFFDGFGRSVASIAGGIGVVDILQRLGNAAVQFGINSVRAAAQMEQWAVSFEVMTGSAATARDLMEEIRSFGAVTPFTTEELVPAAQTLLSMGTAAEDIVGQLRVLGDVAAGMNQPIGDLAQIYGRMQVSGVVMLEDLNRFGDRGIPVMQELGNILNTDVQGVRRLASAGRISFTQVEEAFRRMTGEGGQFHDMMERQARTLNGQWSTFRDNLDAIAVSTGEGINPALRDTLSLLNEMLNTDPTPRMGFFEGISTSLGSLIALFNVALATHRVLMAELETNITPEEASRRVLNLAQAELTLARYQAAIRNNVPLSEIPGGSTLPGAIPRRPQGNQNTQSPVGGGSHQQTMSTPGADAAGMMDALQASKNAQMQHLMLIDQANREQLEAGLKNVDSLINLSQTWLQGMANNYKIDEQNKLASIKRKYAAEADAIKNSTLSEEEKAKKLEELSKRQEAEERRIQRNAAKRQKEMSRFGIYADMAAGVMAAVRAAMVPGLGPFGVGLAIAQGALVTGLGIKQLEMLEKTPLPELNTGAYFGGSPRGTLAWVGDRNKSEWVLPDEKLRQVVREEVGEHTITTYVMLDGDKVGASVDRYRRSKGYDQSASDYNYRNLR